MTETIKNFLTPVIKSDDNTHYKIGLTIIFIIAVCSTPLITSLVEVIINADTSMIVLASVGILSFCIFFFSAAIILLLKIRKSI